MKHKPNARAINVIDIVIMFVIGSVLVVGGTLVAGYFQSSLDTYSVIILPAQARSQINTTFTNI